MSKIIKAIFGGKNNNTTIAGVGAILVVVGSLLTTGEVPDEALAAAMSFLGLGQMAARDGGNGSDA